MLGTARYAWGQIFELCKWIPALVLWYCSSFIRGERDVEWVIERERKIAQVSFLVHSERKSAPFTAFNVLTFLYTSSTIPFSSRAEQVSGADTHRSLFFLLLIYILIKSKMTHQWSFFLQRMVPLHCIAPLVRVWLCKELSCG